MAKENTWKRLKTIPESTVFSCSMKKCSSCIYTMSQCQKEIQEMQITESFQPGFITKQVVPQRNRDKMPGLGFTVTRFGCFHNPSKDLFRQCDHQETPVPGISPPLLCTCTKLFFRQVKAEWGSNNIPRLGTSEMKHKIVA